jgi:hypothetical protein
MRVFQNEATSSYTIDEKFPMLIEGPDYIFIDGEAHNKTTLSPKFATSMHTENPHQYMGLENCTTIPFGYQSGIKLGSSTGLYYYGPFTLNAHFGNHGQSQMNGIHAKIVWPSLYEPGYEYCGESGVATHTRIYKRDKTNNYKRVHTVYDRHAEGTSDAYWLQNYIFHETEDAIFALGCSASVISTSGFTHRINRYQKSTGLYNSFGYNNVYNHGYNMLYLNNDCFIAGRQRWNYTSSRPSWHIQKNNFDDTPGGTGTLYWRDQSPNNAMYCHLRHYVPADNDEYIPTTRTIYHGTTLSDGYVLNLKSGYYHNSSFAMVYDPTTGDGLRNNQDVARMYSVFFDENSSLQMMRFNVPIGNHDMFTSTDAPLFDVRKCNIKTNAVIPSEAIHYNDFTSRDAMYSTSANAGHVFYNTAYFDDENGNNFLIVTGDQTDGLGSYGTHPGATKAFVFEIDDNRVTDYLHEDFSLELTLVQVIDVTDWSLYQSFRPTYDPKYWIALRMDGSVHDVYRWNANIKRFTSSSSITGPISAIGTDTTGRMWTIQIPTVNRYELHIHTIDSPSKLLITPEHTRYEFTGSEIDTYVDVGAYNYEGDYVAVNVTLNINGTGAVFTSTGTQTQTIDTLADNDTRLNIKISSATILDISATIN